MNSETYKIAICDDSQADVEYIAKLVKEWAKDKIVVIKTYPSAEAFMFNYAEEKDFDISARTTSPSKSSLLQAIQNISQTVMMWLRSII